MNQLIGFYMITIAINFGVWMSSMNTFKEAMRNAFVLQIFITLVVAGSYLISNGL